MGRLNGPQLLGHSNRPRPLKTVHGGDLIMAVCFFIGLFQVVLGRFERTKLNRLHELFFNGLFRLALGRFEPSDSSGHRLRDMGS